MKWPLIDPGTLRTQVTALRQSIGAGTSGSKVGYEPYFTMRAAIEEIPEFGRATTEDALTTSQEILILRVYYDARIQSNMRLQAPGGVYIVQRAVNLQGLNVAMRLFCIALADNQ